MVNSELLEQTAQKAGNMPKGEDFLYTDSLVVLGDSADPIENAKNIKPNQKVELGFLMKEPVGDFSIVPMGTITPTTETAAKAVTDNFTDGKKLTNKNKIYIDKTSNLTISNGEIPNQVNILKHSDVTLDDDAKISNSTIKDHSYLHFTKGTNINNAIFKNVMTGTFELYEKTDSGKLITTIKEEKEAQKNGEFIMPPESTFVKGPVKTVITGGAKTYLTSIDLNDNNTLSACDLSNASIENSELVDCQTGNTNTKHAFNKRSTDPIGLNNVKAHNVAIGVNHKNAPKTKFVVINSTLNDSRLMANHSCFTIMNAHVNDSTLFDNPKHKAKYGKPAVIDNSTVTGFITDAPFVIDNAEIKGQQNAPFVAKDLIDIKNAKLQSFYGGILKPNYENVIGIRKDNEVDPVNPKDKYGYDFLKAINKADNIVSVSESYHSMEENHDFSKNILSLEDWQKVNNVIDQVGDLDKAKTKVQTATKASETEPEL